MVYVIDLVLLSLGTIIVITTRARIDRTEKGYSLFFIKKKEEENLKSLSAVQLPLLFLFYHDSFPG